MLCLYACQLWHPLHSSPSFEGGIPHPAFLYKISSLLIKFLLILALWGARARGVS